MRSAYSSGSQVGAEVAEAARDGDAREGADVFPADPAAVLRQRDPLRALHLHLRACGSHQRAVPVPGAGLPPGPAPAARGSAATVLVLYSLGVPLLLAA